MKLTSLLFLLLIFFGKSAIAQFKTVDSAATKEGVAVAELGGVFSKDIKSGRTSWGFNVAAEATPIEHWLEVEIGISPTYAAHYKETDIDFLIKKPWSFSSKLEFMLGIGPEWAHTNQYGSAANSWSGELALDLMYWPFKKHQFGFYAEPAYVYGFDPTHDRSAGISTGLLVNIP